MQERDKYYSRGSVACRQPTVGEVALESCHLGFLAFFTISQEEGAQTGLSPNQMQYHV